MPLSDKEPFDENYEYRVWWKSQANNGATSYVPIVHSDKLFVPRSGDGNLGFIRINCNRKGSMGSGNKVFKIEKRCPKSRITALENVMVFYDSESKRLISEYKDELFDAHERINNLEKRLAKVE